VLVAGAILLALFVLDAPWSIVVIGLAAAVDVAETLFLVWLSKRRRARVGVEALIGARAEVVSACRPEGHVKVVGELWRARCPAGADPGQAVRVLGLDGLTLLVEPEV
jgi:membrane-bound serine protease (ClpP class)